MKKILLLFIVTFAMSANGNAQSLESLWGRLVKKVTNAETTETKTTETKVTETKDNAAQNSESKSLGDELMSIGKALFGDAVDELVGDDKITVADLAGTWNYNGIVCSLESDDMVSQLGAKLVTGKLEEKMNEYLLKVGVKNGSTTIQFAQDGSCLICMGEKQIPGTFTISEDGKGVIFQFLMGQVSLKSEVDLGTDGLTIDFDASKVLEVLKKVGVIANEYAANQQLQQSSTASMISTMITLLDGYNGMRLGARLAK